MVTPGLSGHRILGPMRSSSRSLSNRLLGPRLLAMAFGLLGALPGCSDDETLAPPSSSGDGGGGGGQTGCPAGELMIEDGICRAAGLPPDLPPAGPAAPPLAGVPPDSCSAGFTSDGEGGCIATLPTTPCAAGEMAVPGETACHPIAPCGSGPWSDIPVDGTTQYVDGSHGGASNGSAANPWTTIQAGIDAAAPGAIVAVAAGTYAEDLSVANQAVRIFGRCPTLVEVVSVAAPAAITVDHAPGSELHRLAVTGASRGVDLINSGGAQLERLWIHDLDDNGIRVSASSVETVLQDSLVERARDRAIVTGAGSLRVDRCEIRDTKPRLVDGMEGGGIQADMVPSLGGRSELTVTGSWIHDNRDIGIAILASDLTLVATVVSHTAPAPSAEASGHGVLISELDGERATATVQGSVIASNQSAGLTWWGSDGVVTETTVQDTTACVGHTWGMGIHADYGWEISQRSDVAVERSTLRDNVNAAAWARSSDLRLHRTLVQRTVPAPLAPDGGQGVRVTTGDAVPGPSTATVSECLIEQNHENGIQVLGGEATITDTIVRDSLPQVGGGVAFGVAVLGDWIPTPGAVSVQTSLIERSHGIGVFGDSSTLVVTGTIVRDTLPDQATGTLGVGLLVATRATSVARGSATVTGSVIELSHSTGIMSQGADLDVAATVVRDTQPTEADGRLGRGIDLQPLDGYLPTGTVRWSLVEDNRDLGIAAWSAELTIEGTLVRDILPEAADQVWGAGILAGAGPQLAHPSVLTLRGAVIEGCHTAGIALEASVATVESSIVRDLEAQLSDDEFGRCISVQKGGSLHLVSSVVARCREAGISLDLSSASIQDSTVGEVTPTVGSARFGDGILMWVEPGTAPLTVSDSVLHSHARAGITNFGGTVELSGTRFECNPIDLDGETWHGPAVFNDLGGNQCGCNGEWALAVKPRRGR